MFQTTNQIYCGISSPIVMNYDNPQFDKYLLASIISSNHQGRWTLWHSEFATSWKDMS